MGQSLPLPKKIPRPTNTQNEYLKQMGIVVDMEGRNPENPTIIPAYVTYELPTEWKIVDHSHTHDLPIYYIVDNQNKQRVCIGGSWKGLDDNKLDIYILSDDEL